MRGLAVLALAIVGFLDTGRVPGSLASAGPRLVSVAPLMQPEDMVCAWPGSTPARLAMFHQGRQVQAPADRLNRAPVRVISDQFPTFSAVAVDPIRNELVLQDENLFQILVYRRTANTPANATFTEPTRVIGGDKTKVEFNCALYIDPGNGDIYSVNNDVMDTMVVFDRNASGDVAPTRELSTPHRAYGLAVDEDRKELFLTIQHPPTVVVYDKHASDEAPPRRIIGGHGTGLEDPHGITIDRKNQLLYVSNHGAYSLSQEGSSLARLSSWAGRGRQERMIPGTGKFEPPSITVYPLTASGDAAPVRIIEGPRTRLNWPAHIYLDEERGELYVANDPDDSVLVFRAGDSGDVAPIRVIEGPNTGLKFPTSVVLDLKNDELIVANMGNHTATVYPRAASGDAKPIRTIRAAPEGKEALAIGNPGAVAYDTKREEILVPN